MKCAEIHLTQRKEHDEVGWLGHQQTLYCGSMDNGGVFITLSSHKKKKRLETFYDAGWLYRDPYNGMSIRYVIIPMGSKITYITQATRSFCGSCIYPSFLQKIAPKQALQEGLTWWHKNCSSSNELLHAGGKLWQNKTVVLQWWWIPW